MSVVGKVNVPVWGKNVYPVDFARRHGPIGEYLTARAAQLGFSGQDLGIFLSANNLVQNMLLMKETGYGKKQTTGKSSAKGLFGIINATFNTIKNSRYTGKYGPHMDAFMRRVKAANSPFDLSPYDQATMSILASDFPGPRRKKYNTYYTNMVNAIKTGNSNALAQNALGFVIDNHWAGGNHPDRNPTIRLYTNGINEILSYLTRGGAFI